ncbi:hypothetical protein [Levilactobacillus tujiorum]|uniref:hypothetical protein n=1 Tax=Levilactobacillus tujiorum TaxID=2912243 RepID=UPI0014575FFA|nr:hypothetical protein [Levilactobacillus tujiorum]NLR31920.1 hypothetical protein [Levilactobacillus tujiorum]
MTRAQRIVRFTFWNNNLTFVILGILFWVDMPVWLNLMVVLLISANLAGLMWYLNRLGIKKISGLYFVDDERDKAVALRVHNACMNTLLQGMFLLILVVFVLKSPDWQLTVTTFGNIILGLLLLVMVASNCQYYYLWQKYDRD